MGITHEEWMDRMQNRSDMTGFLTHLTKPNIDEINKDMNDREINERAIDNLIKILTEKKIIGSTTESGFIVGNTRAVCFQDVPLYGLIQNVAYEKAKRKENNQKKIRYCGIGLNFNKGFIFREGGRPVFYEKTELAKRLLPAEEYWRIVKFDLSNKLSIIDWTHEREWRLPGDLEFEYNQVMIILDDPKDRKYFLEKCPEDIHKSVAGIIILKAILY